MDKTIKSILHDVTNADAREKYSMYSLISRYQIKAKDNQPTVHNPKEARILFQKQMKQMQRSTTTIGPRSKQRDV